jgi:hypothetical protein
MTATINELIAEVIASASLGQLVSFVALGHHPHPRMVKPAEPPALSQGSARKSATGARAGVRSAEPASASAAVAGPRAGAIWQRV